MKDRLKEIIDYYNLNTHQFEVKINASESTIRKALVGKNSISTDTLLKISDTFPEINLDWLITGKGEMLRHEAPTATTEPRNDTLAALIASFQATLAEKDKQIDHLLDIIHSLTSNKIQ